MLIKKWALLFLQRVPVLIIILLLTASNDTHSQTSPNYLSKKGGICFRTDDDQPISKYLEYAAIFNNYNQKFNFAINLDMPEITPDYVNGLRQLQASGHEMLDHTPWHRTNYFFTNLTTDYYINHPGVQRIFGNKIELKHSNVDIASAKRTDYVNISCDTITSTSGIFSSFSKSDCYLYFPTLNKLVFIHEIVGWINQNTVKVFDIWDNSINLGSYQNIQFYNFDYDKVHLTVDGIKALAEEQVRLANYYNLERPISWVQPGGYHPHLYKNELKLALGDGLGYKSAGVFADPGLKVFNEYNPDNDKQFGMNYGDFRDDNWTLDSCKKFIAERIAKHYVLFGETHFTYSIGGLLGGWTGFLQRTEGLLQWCTQNNIPIRTYSEWADILYNQIPNPNENIIPPLNFDLDLNNVPDGYNLNQQVTLVKTDGYPSVNDYCYSINKVGDICSISNLGGIEKGVNEFEIWTKGKSGDFIEVIFKVGTQNLVYKFPAKNSQWTKFNLTQSVNGNTSRLNIPDNISLIDVTVRCSNYSSGTVKISGMKLIKYLASSAYLNVDPTYANASSQSGSTFINIYSNISWTATDNASWLTILPSSGSNNGNITASYTGNTTSNQRLGTITITGGGITRTVTITQSAANQLEVTPSNQSVAYVTGNTSFTLTSNIDWTVSDNATWLTLSRLSGLNNGSFTATFIENTTTSQRVGTITITGGGITRTVTVTQAAGIFSQNCPTNIISYWKLDESAGNIFFDSYNGFDGQAGIDSPLPINGVIKNGYIFDGINDEINVPPSTNFDFAAGSSFTIEFWIKRPGSIQGTEVAIGRDDAGTQLHWWVGLNSMGRMTFYIVSTTGETYSVADTSALNDSSWHQVVAVRDANLNQLKLYIDGKLKSTTSASYTHGFGSSTANLNIGWLNLGGGFHFKGAIDELAIYNNVLSAIEIENHYQADLYGIGYCDPKVVLNTKLFLEGPYDSSLHRMSTSIDNIPTTSPYTQDPRTVSRIPSDVVDWVFVELRLNASEPPNVSKSVLLNKNGSLVTDDGFTQNIWLNTKPGNYYITIKHRNSIETWSSMQHPFSLETPRYDFTLDSSKAYGNNLKKIGASWCIYSGDVNQDGLVDLSDEIDIGNDVNHFAFGSYLITDLNCDQQVDLSDIIFVSNNTNLFISKHTPESKSYLPTTGK